MTTTIATIDQATRDAILASIELDHIDAIDDEHDPEVYSTNILMDVTIDGTTYTVVHQRGTDGDVERAPTRDCGIADVYLAVLKLTGEFDGQDEDDAIDMFENDPSEWDLSSEAYNFGWAIGTKIAQAAEAAQNEYDAKHDAELVYTPEFGVDAHGKVVDVDSDKAVLRFNHANTSYGNMIQFNVSKKNEDNEWRDAGGFDCFHFHLEPAEVFRRYQAR